MVNPLPFAESQQLGNAAATVYTSPAQVTSIVKKCTLLNTDAATGYLVTLYIVPSGGTAATANLVLNARAIGPKQTLDITELVNQILAGGDFISVFADTAAKVNIRISGVQIN